MEALCFTEKWDQRNVLNFILYDLYFEKLENVNICFVTLETQNCCSWTRDDTPPCPAGRFRAQDEISRIRKWKLNVNT